DSRPSRAQSSAHAGAAGPNRPDPHSPSRSIVARRPHYATLVDELRLLEVALVIVTAPELGDSAQDSFILNIMASFAEFERELIAARIAESRAQLKARHLRFAGGVPFGYDSNRRTRQLVHN